jgi:hypothetical protein
MLRTVETSDEIFLITSVHLMFTSMNLTVLVLPLERLGLVFSWRISYDQTCSTKGMITRAPEDKIR